MEVAAKDNIRITGHSANYRRSGSGKAAAVSPPVVSGRRGRKRLAGPVRREIRGLGPREDPDLTAALL